MVENLLEYYERELTFLRRLGGEFSRRYPKIAKRLLLEPDKCDDPHVERILEGVAFLAARVHRKLDEEFPEIAGSFIESLLPHYLQPIPSLSIAQVHPKPGKWLDLPAGVQLQTRLIRAYNTRCKFRTCLPVQSWPVVVSELSWASPGTLRLPSELSCPSVLRMILRCTEGSFAALRPPHARDTLRLYLDGPRQFALYEVLLSCSASQLSPQVLLRTTDGALVPLSLRPVGFEPSEGLLPYSGRSFLGQRLLTEYFAFPSKFLFVDLGGLSEKIRSRLDERAEVLFLSGIPAGTLIPQLDDVKLGCVPIVNLFAQPAEPINLSHTRTEYRVVPDARHQDTTEVYAIEEVVAAQLGRSEVQIYRPLYGLSDRLPAALGNPQGDQYYVQSRRTQEDGSEVYLSLVDRSFSPRNTGHDTLLVSTLCTNRLLAGRLPLGTARRARAIGKQTERGVADEYELETEGDFQPAASFADSIAQVDCLERPTAPLPLPTDKSLLWRLVSHLGLNHHSLGFSPEGVLALRELLSLYDRSAAGEASLQVSGVVALHTERTVARARDGLPGFCRGLAITITLREENFVGGSAYLFASVLDRFFAQYVTLNSFTQLSAVNEQGRMIGRFAPRMGERAVL